MLQETLWLYSGYQEQLGVAGMHFDLYCEQPLRQPSLASHRKCEVDVCAIVFVF